MLEILPNETVFIIDNIQKFYGFLKDYKNVILFSFL